MRVFQFEGQKGVLGVSFYLLTFLMPLMFHVFMFCFLHSANTMPCTTDIITLLVLYTHTDVAISITRNQTYSVLNWNL